MHLTAKGQAQFSWNICLLLPSSPRDLATFQRYLQPVINAAKSPASAFSHAVNGASTMSPESILNRIRNASTQQMVSVGVIGAELLGFFTVGEMIGRFKLVGYRGDVQHHETATPHD